MQQEQNIAVSIDEINSIQIAPLDNGHLFWHCYLTTDIVFQILPNNSKS